MKQTQKAPYWVMAGVLGVIILTCIPGILLMLNLVTPETISFSNEYGESASSSFVSGIWIINVIAIVFFVAITILAFIRNWSNAIAIGGIILIIANVFSIWQSLCCSSASSYQELIVAIRDAQMFGIMESLLYVSGNLIIAFNSSISGLTKTIFAIYIVIFSLLFLLPLPVSLSLAVSNAIIVTKPIFAALLLYLCASSKRS